MLKIYCSSCSLYVDILVNIREKDIDNNKLVKNGIKIDYCIHYKNNE